MDIFEIRKANLIRLIGSRRKGACAEKWEMAPAHLSQVLSNKTAKNLGEDVARRIEQKEGLPHGWLDALKTEEIAEMAEAVRPRDSSHSVGEHAANYSGQLSTSSAKRKYQADLYQAVKPEHRQAVDEIADKMLALTPEQALKLKQAMDLLMPANEPRKD